MEEIDRAVVDSSFVLSFLLPDESISEVEDVFDKYFAGQVILIAPIFLNFEVFNGLYTAILKHRIGFKLAQKLGEKFLSLNITLLEIDYLKSFGLAAKESVTFYDASFLYLAKEEDLELLTLDKGLKKFAKSI